MRHLTLFPLPLASAIRLPTLPKTGEPKRVSFRGREDPEAARSASSLELNACPVSQKPLQSPQTVAAILVAVDRSGQSLLIQIQQALVGPGFKNRWFYSPFQIQLIESMLLECLEEPRPLMRSVLGKDHPLIREAEKNAARPPPDSEDEAASA